MRIKKNRRGKEIEADSLKNLFMFKTMFFKEKLSQRKLDNLNQEVFEILC